MAQFIGTTRSDYSTHSTTLHTRLLFTLDFSFMESSTVSTGDMSQPLGLAVNAAPSDVVLEVVHEEPLDVDKAEHSDQEVCEWLDGDEERDGNPALAIKTHVTLDIEPFPDEILRRDNVENSFKAMEKDGELVVPITSLYYCVWDGVPTYLEEKDNVWCGAEHGRTTWLNSKRLGTFSTPLNE